MKTRKRITRIRKMSRQKINEVDSEAKPHRFVGIWSLIIMHNAVLKRALCCDFF